MEAMLAAGAAPVSGVVLAFTVLVTSIALVAGLAWVSRQLLGAPVGTVRALIAGVLGFAAAVGITQLLQPVQSSGHVAAFITVALGVPLIVAMIFIVVAEALVPTGTGPQPVEIIRGTRRAYARSRRYSQITRIAVRHGLGPYLRGRRQRDADATEMFTDLFRLGSRQRAALRR
jgi:ubiquinone biosynthesis protein